MATRVLVLLAGLVGLMLAQSPSAASVGAAAVGKDIFEKRCTGCHALDSQRAGPKLRGVYGRKAGVVDGFPYSDELKASRIVWDAVTLDKWLTDPEALVPGSDMAFRVPKAEERTAIIEFLRSGSAASERR
jgi:cytochrome c